MSWETSDRQRAKLLVISVCLLIAAGTLTSHSTESLWPAISLVALVAGVITVAAILRDGDSRVALILMTIVSVAVFVRLFPALSVPTLPGNDPHKYAVAVHSVLEYGATDRIPLPFYASVPAFVTVSAALSTVLGASAWGGLTAYPLLIGLLLPLLAFTLARRFWGDNTVALLAALLAAVAVEGVRYAVQPNANMLAILLFGLLVLGMYRYIRSGAARDLAVVVAVAAALLLTHKLAPVMVIGFVVITSVALRFWSTEGPPHSRFARRASGALIGLAVIGGVFQWAFITDFGAAAVLRLVTLDASPGATTTPPPEAARHVSDTIWHTLHRRMHALTLLAVAGVAWLYVAFRRDAVPTTLIAATIAMGALMPIAVLDPTAINPVRVYFSLELLLTVIAAVGCVALLRRGGDARHLAVTVLVGVLVAQAGSAFFVADVPTENREYLTEQEIEGKAFAQAATGDVGSDWFYSDQAANLDHAETERDWQAIHPELFNGDPEAANTEYVAYRTDAEPYRVYQPWSGRWVLTYDAEESLDADRHRIYSNRDVRFYARSQ